MKITGIVSILFTLAVGTLAELTSPVDSIKHINEAVAAYRRSLDEWDGRTTTGLGLWRKSNGLIATLKATKPGEQASKRAVLTPEERDKLEQEGFDAAHALVGEVRAAMDTAISKKSDMDAVPVLGKRVPMQSLKGMQKEASRLSNVLAAAASTSRQGEA
ncbi:Cell wall galactomannoprotein [Metarhizium guizhouense ARSEF 977]|uniref:Cell wall galactomannoprotein n=1 Tax=Metarhizium guizhouense (strain ARSEF 977) TaxID=1276136 RepID=A0A0B4H5D9_METGA|nr:Cell wall galactomannoprotein [Metarhizium guizhouense ARSEF 977]